MRLTLENFKQFSSIAFEFEKEKATYISGKSGSGKTTIFTAFIWALYGVNTCDMVNWINPESTPFVTLTTDSIFISRKGASSLYVKNASGDHYAQAAQQEIVKAYGSIDVMMCTSYKREGSLHPIIEAGPKERFRLMTSLMSKCDPTEIVAKLTSIQKQKEMLLVEANAKKSILEDNYRRDYTYVQDCWLLSNDSMREKRERVDYLTNVGMGLQRRIEISSSIEVQHKLLSSMLREAEDKIRFIGFYSRGELNVLKARAVSFREYSEYAKKREDIERRIVELEVVLVNTAIADPTRRTVSDVDITNATVHEKKYELLSECCRSQGILCDKKSVDNAISEKEAILNAQQDKANLRRRAALLEERSLLTLPLTPERSNDVLTSELELLQTTYVNDIVEFSETKARIERDTMKSLELVKLELVSSNASRLESTSCEYRAKVDVLRQRFESTKSTILSSLTNITQLIALKELSRHVNPCPYCRGSLRTVGDIPVKSTDSVFDREGIANLIREKSQYEASLEEASRNLQADLDALESQHNLSVCEVNNGLRARISQVESSYQATLLEKTRSLDDKIRCLKESSNKQRVELLEQLEIYKSIDVVKSQLSIIDASLSSIICNDNDLPELTTDEISQYVKDLDRLRRIEVVDEPTISVKELEKIRLWNRVYSELEEARNQLNSLRVVAKEVPVNIDIVGYEERVNALESLENDRVNLWNKVGSLPRFEQTYLIREDEKRVSIERYNVIEEIQRSILAYNALGERQIIDLIRRDAEMLISELNKLKQLKDDIQSSVSEALLKTTYSVNTFLEPVCQSMFTDPISIELTTTKVLKTTGENRPSIGLSIRYKGGVVSDPRLLSYGECVRINTALSLAFANHAKSKVMIFDEATSNLDSETEDAVISTIRECMPGIMLLVTCHKSHTGNYDNTVSL